MNNNGHKHLGPLRYRLITKQEWDRLTPIFQDMNKFMPDRELAIASIAETIEGEIVGMVALQMCPYLGPLFVDARYTSAVNYSLLKAEIDKVYLKNTNKPLVIQSYVAMTSDERIARIAEMAGMTRKPEAILLVQQFGEEHTLIG